MKLNPVNKTKNGNRYCGPAVISSVTGCTTDEAAKLMMSRKSTANGSDSAPGGSGPEEQVEFPTSGAPPSHFKTQAP